MLYYASRKQDPQIPLGAIVDGRHGILVPTKSEMKRALVFLQILMVAEELSYICKRIQLKLYYFRTAYIRSIFTVLLKN